MPMKLKLLKDLDNAANRLTNIIQKEVLNSTRRNHQENKIQNNTTNQVTSELVQNLLNLIEE